MSLTPTQIAIIKSSIPALQDANATLAKTFYASMMSENPGLKDIFNSAHQSSEAQPRALTHALLMYATYIEDLPKLNQLVTRIVDKHVSLQIPKQGYSIVGTYLLRTMLELLGPEVASQEFLEAWGLAYQSLADLLMSLEDKAYTRNREGGWPGHQPFKVTRKTKETDNVVSLYFESVGDSFIVPTAGQYLGFKFIVGGKQQCREYSISGVDAAKKQYRISVKRIPAGIVSNFIHDEVKIGDLLYAVAPQGHHFQLPTTSEEQQQEPNAMANNNIKSKGFSHGIAITYKNGLTKVHDISNQEQEGPVDICPISESLGDIPGIHRPSQPRRTKIMLLAAGIGITPFINMANDALKAGIAVHLVQCDKNTEIAPFVEHFDRLAERYKDHDQLLVDRVFSAAGHRLDRSTLSRLISKSAPDNLYVVGPNAFMADVRRFVSELELNELKCAYHFFGPYSLLQQQEPEKNS